MASQTEFDRAISETQAAYTRVMETSQTLLKSLRTAATRLESGEEPLQKSDFKLPRASLRRDLTTKY